MDELENDPVGKRIYDLGTKFHEICLDECELLKESHPGEILNSFTFEQNFILNVAQQLQALIYIYSTLPLYDRIQMCMKLNKELIDGMKNLEIDLDLSNEE